MPSSPFMRRAITLAVDNVRSGRGGPFGAVVVCGGAVIAEGVNLVTASFDPTAHAEMLAIREACRKRESFELRDCELYSSCEPCPMCLGAIYWARLGRIYFACTREDAAAAGFDDSLIYSQFALPYAERGVRCENLLREEGLAAFQEWGASGNKVPY